MNQTEPQAGLTRQLHGLSPPALLTIICLACTGVGAFFGSIYCLPGVVWGGFGGQLAGFIWTPIMLKQARKGFQRGRLVASGAAIGVAAGMTGSTFLHVVLFVSEPMPLVGLPVMLLILLLFGGVCGGAVGAVAGALFGLLVPKRRRR